MPKSGRITSYPIEYFNLFNRAIYGEKLTFMFKDKKAAENSRFDMYAFRKALREDTESDEASLQLALFADSLEFLIENNILTVQSRDKSENLNVIKNVLNGE